MGPYRSLFSVAVEHGFFRDGLWRGLRFVPCAATRALIDRTGMIVRKTVNGFELYRDRGRSEAWPLFLAETDGVLRFRFKVYADDEEFKIYSESFSGNGGMLPCFDSEQGVPDGGRIRLHREEQVSDSDRQPVDSEVLSGLLERRDRLVPPAFVLSVLFRPPPDDASRKKNSTAGPGRYFLRFGSRRTYWTYYLLGSFADRPASIVDLDEGIGFEPLDRVSLSDRRSALAFRSKVAIPLRQYSACRFQLRETGPGRNRILIRRLPVAAARQLNRKIIDGEVVSISEIYVND